MSEIQSGNVQEHDIIAFDQGGLIRGDVPQNWKLLELIQQTPALPPEALLNLANHYIPNPTSRALGKHLTEMALSELGKEAIPQMGVLLRTEYLDWGDFWEDFADGGSDDGRERNQSQNIQLSARRVVVSGIGLLIETLTIIYEDDHTEKNAQKVNNLHFVIAVCPGLDALSSVSTRGSTASQVAIEKSHG